MAIEKMYYPKLTYASSTIEGIFLFGILCLSNKIYGLESLYYIGNFQIIHMEEPNKSHWETPLVTNLEMAAQIVQIPKNISQWYTILRISVNFKW